MSLVSDGIVITAAIVGAEVTRDETPYVPYTAEEIAEEARRCVEAGAAIIHLHVRNPDGAPSQDERAVSRGHRAIRARCDVVVQVSTGGAVGMSLEERLGGLSAGAEMATLNCGCVNFGDDVFVNIHARHARGRAAHPRARPVAGARALRAGPPRQRHAPGSTEGLVGVSRCGCSSCWACRARSARARACCASCVQELPRERALERGGRRAARVSDGEPSRMELGGHVRVGLEDNLYLERGVLRQGQRAAGGARRCSWRASAAGSRSACAE